MPWRRLRQGKLSVGASLFPNSSQKIGVVGGGTMGTGIAYVSAAVGHRVTVVEPNQNNVRLLHVRLSDAAQSGIQRNKLDPNQAKQLLERISIVSNISELDAELDLVVETVPEIFELKVSVLTEINLTNPKIIASNTSSMSVTALAKSVQNEKKFLGMHFFNPVWSLPLLEIIKGKNTDELTVNSARSFAATINKETITVNDVPGFATSRLDLIASLEAMRMLEDGVASAEDIDKAMVIAYRHPIGPLHLSDVVGLDVRLDIARNLNDKLGDRFSPPKILEDLVAQGYLGVKTGRGFFDWSESSNL